MLAHNILRKLFIASGWFLFAAAFIGVFYIFSDSWPKVDSATALVLATVVAAPFAIAMVWDRLSKFKIASIEISLLEKVAFKVDEALAEAVQEQKSSATKPIIDQISKAIEKDEYELVQINLKEGKYWWSTRLFLLAALAEEYTKIKQLIFVENKNQCYYIGMATPAAVRKKMAQRYPEFERIYQLVQGDSIFTVKTDPLRNKIESIAYGWPGSFNSGTEYKEVPEENHMELVSADLVKKWLGDELIMDYVKRGLGPETDLLYYEILFADKLHVPLVKNRRLEKVVSPSKLATQIAKSVLKQKLGRSNN